MDCEECLNDQIGSMSLTGQEPRPPMYVQRLTHILRTVLLMFREVLLDCLTPQDQVDGAAGGVMPDDPIVELINALLTELDVEYTGGVLQDLVIV